MFKSTQVATLILLSALSVYAQNANPMDHSKHQQANILSAMHAPMMKGALSQSGNIDKDFLIDMIPHHQGAIDSAKLVLRQGKNPEVLALAKAIIAAQEKEIKEFNDLIQKGFEGTKLDEKTYKEALRLNEKIHHTMMQEMNKVKSTNPDKDFIDGMIQHHIAATESSKLILKYTKNDMIKKIANNIIAAQEKEIIFMQNLSKKL